MALTGQLSDMSLAELIEFFCNQRKTGRLKVDYHRGHGVFFIKEGELVDAKVGQLSGAEAVYFALTLPNAAFDFSPEVQPTRRTINDAWTQIVLEGLRRLDEGLSPTEADAFGGWSPNEADMAVFMDQVERLGDGQAKAQRQEAKESAPFSMMVESASSDGGGKKKMMIMAAAACVVLAVCVAAVPLLRGSGEKKAAAPVAAAAPAAQQPETAAEPAAEPAPDTTSAAPEQTAVAPGTASQDAVAAAQREAREREQKLRELRERKAEELAKKTEAAAAAPAAAAPVPAAAAAPAAVGPKTVRVQVNYDEAGRVTTASVAGASPGAEAFSGTAVRVARGKRFPAGKSGSTIITIPVN
jgi:flagellar basal body-associated protein FliL